jgi:hypothetical protein
MKAGWVRTLLILLVGEKIIQHIFVTAAFYSNWKDIRSTVAVSPEALMVLGGVVVLLFVLSLWGLFTRKIWATSLIMGLALFDLVGEFVAQGRVDIVINVSFLSASLLLILAFIYGRKRKQKA